eukprot:CAMPEP_0119566522 /NCGR_PEP_ID=MMETSP1352-20130426/33296_1 /TAXON_ID=265584 /ORGANISM="Stauroneis constricta, Strain CCMP1120" /LENGTH=67 /DNA_ID=CAMNT_0007615641 /DNA_START=121 /DNA_END=321 /DNA_ORIENTATION=+
MTVISDDPRSMIQPAASSGQTRNALVIAIIATMDAETANGVSMLLTCAIVAFFSCGVCDNCSALRCS